jgi:23S rRNA U2552 (ribose-2'-O)-methylase RlmE/FtsJ
MNRAIRAFFSYFGMTSSGLGKFAFKDITKIKQDIKGKYKFEGDLLDIYVNNKGNIVHKWHHYLPIYDQYFSRFRGRKVRFLEIGVNKGGSLEMWRKYFGKNAVIYGVDINPDCARFNGVAGEVRIGSQDDPVFLNKVLEEMGGVDIVLDDGSHQMMHIKSSLKYIFSQLTDGGIYMIEDLHCAYWRKFGGGFGVRANFFRLVDQIINDMHHWYHANGMKVAAISENCTAIHIHDSITVLEKGKNYRPSHSKVG